MCAGEHRRSRGCSFCQKSDRVPETVDGRAQESDTSLDRSRCTACNLAQQRDKRATLNRRKARKGYVICKALRVRHEQPRPAEGKRRCHDMDSGQSSQGEREFALRGWKSDLYEPRSCSGAAIANRGGMSPVAIHMLPLLQKVFQSGKYFRSSISTGQVSSKKRVMPAMLTTALAIHKLHFRWPSSLASVSAVTAGSSNPASLARGSLSSLPSQRAKSSGRGALPFSVSSRSASLR